MNLVRRLAGIAVLALSSAMAPAQDPVAAAPDHHRVLLENEHVRVLEVRVKPGERVPTHAHPEYAAYVVTGGRVRFTGPDGAVETLEHEAGAGAIKEAEQHAFENIGRGELHVVLIELKPRAAGATPPPAAPTGDDPLSVCRDCAKLLAENERMRLYEVVLRPGQSAGMHVHPANVVYTLTEVRAKFTLPDGSSTERTLPAGAAGWSEPVKHAVENVGKSPAQFIHLELKVPAASQPAANER
jgi:quercetin dioxygenase-like cupin family protein